MDKEPNTLPDISDSLDSLKHTIQQAHDSLLLPEPKPIRHYGPRRYSPILPSVDIPQTRIRNRCDHCHKNINCAAQMSWAIYKTTSPLRRFCSYKCIYQYYTRPPICMLPGYIERRPMLVLPAQARIITHCNGCGTAIHLRADTHFVISGRRRVVIARFCSFECLVQYTG